MTKMCSRTLAREYFFYPMFISMLAESSRGNTTPTVSSPLFPCPKIVTRAEWGAREPKSETYLASQPVPYAFIHHSAGRECFNIDSCSSVVRGYQDLHMDSRGWDDIGYSFVIGGDGTVFEGRGWDRVGAHTLGFNSVGLGFCLSGDFTHFLPPKIQVDAARQLIDYGVAMGKIDRNYTLRGHRDMKPSTSCPGDALYAEIRTWSHYLGTDDSRGTSVERSSTATFSDDATPSPSDAAAYSGDVSVADEVRLFR